MYKVDPREYYFRDQPAGIGAMLYIKDTLNGNRFVTVDKVILEGTKLFAVIGEKTIQLDGYNLYVPRSANKITIPNVVDDIYQVLDHNVLCSIDNVDYDLKLRENQYFEEFGMKDLIQIVKNAVDAVNRDMVRRNVVDKDITYLRRILTIGHLAEMINLINNGFYDEATKLLDTIKTDINDYRAMTKKITG